MFVAIFDISTVLRKSWLDVALTLWFIKLPGAWVKLFSRFPFSVAVLHTVDEGSVIDVAVPPDEDAILVFGFVVEKIADVYISIDVFEPVAVLAVILKVSFIKPEKRGFVDE